MSELLDGRKALITGASAGIGWAIAALFAKQGAELCLVGRRKEALSEIASLCRSYGVGVTEINADLTDDSQVQEVAERSLAAIQKIDILINNAGYGKYGSFLQMPIEELDRMWRINVRSVFLLTQKIAPHMVAAKNGHIINISSMHGVHALAGGSGYCTTKFALMGLTEALCKELYKEGIKVSVVCPGGVLTEFGGVPPDRKDQDLMDPEEIAQVVLDLVSLTGKALVTHVFVSPRTRPFVPHERK